MNINGMNGKKATNSKHFKPIFKVSLIIPKHPFGKSLDGIDDDRSSTIDNQHKHQRAEAHYRSNRKSRQDAYHA
jgi:hypothetical protein